MPNRDRKESLISLDQVGNQVNLTIVSLNCVIVFTLIICALKILGWQTSNIRLLHNG